jgi:acetyl-CoA carboxylase carboxyltransferase component
MSDDPGHRPDVTAPPQQPAEMETQTPSMPPTLSNRRYNEKQFISKLVDDELYLHVAW